MQIDEVLKISHEKKEEYLREITSDNHPFGILLGGQGAVGKGQLNLWAERLYPENTFLAINGDNYRIFSHRFSFVVEGTMRTANIPLKTAEKLRSYGFQTAAFAIAACKEFSLLNAFVRYYKEVQTKGFGRMIDIESHNSAVEGLPKSLDILYTEKSVDRICLFDCFANNLIADYQLSNGDWNCQTLPSVIVLTAREKQLHDTEAVENLLEESRKVLEQLKDEGITELMQSAYDDLFSKTTIPSLTFQ